MVEKELLRQIKALKQRVAHNENFILKVASEIGDLMRIIRQLQAQVTKLKRRKT